MRTSGLIISGIAVLLLLASSLAHGFKDPRLVEAAGKGDAAGVQALLSGKADVNSADGNGVTALMAASADGNAYIVNKLLAAGADVKVGDNEGKTALKYALENNHIHIGKLLTAAGASWEADKLDNRTTAGADGLTGGESGEDGLGGAGVPGAGGAGGTGPGGTGAAGTGASSAVAGSAGENAPGASGGAGYPQSGSYGGEGGAAYGQGGGGQGEQGARMAGQAMEKIEKVGKKALTVFLLMGLLALLGALAYWTGLISRLMGVFDRGDSTLNSKFTVKKTYHEGLLAERGERYADAVKHYERVLSLDSGHKDARFHLAKVCHRKMGDPLSARKHYMAIIKQMPRKHAYYKEAMEALREMGVSDVDQ